MKMTYLQAVKMIWKFTYVDWNENSYQVHLVDYLDDTETFFRLVALYQNERNFSKLLQLDISENRWHYVFCWQNIFGVVWRGFLLLLLLLVVAVMVLVSILWWECLFLKKTPPPIYRQNHIYKLYMQACRDLFPSQ